MNWINVLVVLTMIVLASLFSSANLGLISLGFLTWQSEPMPLYLIVLSAFLSGFLGGVLALSFSRRKHKVEIASLRHENALLRTELDNLRNFPLQDEL